MAVTIKRQSEAYPTPAADASQDDAAAARSKEWGAPPLAETPDDDIREGRFRFYGSSEEFLASIEARIEHQ